tara:strand:+ start:360 stop:665 length:306 start_codon:yes stop_codon:yes gene_type:complete
MANNRFIYPKADGTMGVFIPAPKKLASLTGSDFDTIDKKLIHIADKTIPTGTKYELIDESVDLSDRTFRNAWEYTADASVERTSADLSAEDLTKYNMTENL